MSEPVPVSIDGPRIFPRVPSYAWSWLQRSRPVLGEVSQRLTGGPPPAGFVETLGERFAADPFTRDVVVGAIADKAFNGRIPLFRPAGVSWDRGLSWWAAAIAGITPQEFDAGPVDAVQSRLFGLEAKPPRRAPVTPTRRTAASERAAIAGALRDLLRTSEGDAVPVAAVRQLLAYLEEPLSAEASPPE